MWLYILGGPMKFNKWPIVYSIEKNSYLMQV